MPKKRLTAPEVEELLWEMEGVEFAEATEATYPDSDPTIILNLGIRGKDHKFELHDSLTEKELLTLVGVITGSRRKARTDIERFEIENW